MHNNDNKYRALFEKSADAILIIEDGIFVDCNDAAVHMLRASSRPEVLQTHPSMLSPEFQPDGRTSYEKANEMIQLAFDQGNHRFEWMHKRLDGTVFPVEVLLTAVPEEDGKQILHVVWRDITERKQLEEENQNNIQALIDSEKKLLHARKMEAVGVLAGGIAHDFNNMLSGIMGCAELLLTRCEDDENVQKFAGLILDTAERSAELVSKLKDFSRKT